MNFKTLENIIRKGFYISCLDPCDRATIRLINRYRDKISDRLISSEKNLLNKGEKRAEKIIDELSYKENFFLKRIK